jgi:hypothetical protein
MSVTRPAWWSQSILLLLLVVISCDQAGDRQRVIAEAVEAKNGGRFKRPPSSITKRNGSGLSMQNSVS